jgi:hypothetical protein
MKSRVPQIDSQQSSDSPSSVLKNINISLLENRAVPLSVNSIKSGICSPDHKLIDRTMVFGNQMRPPIKRRVGVLALLRKGNKFKLTIFKA